MHHKDNMDNRTKIYSRANINNKTNRANKDIYNY